MKVIIDINKIIHIKFRWEVVAATPTFEWATNDEVIQFVSRNE